MKTSINPLARTLMLTLAIAAAPALAGGPATTGALATPANRIVGLWTTEAEVRLCGNPSATPIGIRNTLLFNAGGTVMENPRVLPSGTGPGRSFAIGEWSYDPETGHYVMLLRFDNYVNGDYAGFQTVDRDIVLTANGSIASGPVISTRYDTSGNQLGQLCGTATSTRL